MTYLEQYLDNQVALSGFTGSRAEKFRELQQKKKRKKKREEKNDKTMEDNGDGKNVPKILALLGAGGLLVGGIYYFYKNRKGSPPRDNDISKMEDQTGEKLTGKRGKDSGENEEIDTNNMPEDVARNIRILQKRDEL